MPLPALTAKPFIGALMPGAIRDPAIDPSWYRLDGSRKGLGFLGALQAPDGRTSTELSIGVNVGGKEMEIPSLVPTLTPDEVKHLLGGGEMTEAIIQKAVQHAQERIKNGLPVFAE